MTRPPLGISFDAQPGGGASRGRKTMRSYNRRARIGGSILALFAPLVLTGSAPLDDDPPLAGTWIWRWKDENDVMHQHVLVVEGSGKSLAATERFDDQPAVTVNDLKRHGKAVRFAVLRGEVRAAYSGKLVDKDTINGEVMVTDESGQVETFGWTAKREPTTSD